ncbi:hypothetical protein SESBI_14551 [Sesbania bispinosa]|nr:hypothetical protein SESBI_14551 [Sesbania bispinosa]
MRSLCVESSFQKNFWIESCSNTNKAICAHHLEPPCHGRLKGEDQWLTLTVLRRGTTAFDGGTAAAPRGPRWEGRRCGGRTWNNTQIWAAGRCAGKRKGQWQRRIVIFQRVDPRGASGESADNGGVKAGREWRSSSEGRGSGEEGSREMSQRHDQICGGRRSKEVARVMVEHIADDHLPHQFFRSNPNSTKAASTVLYHMGNVPIPVPVSAIRFIIFLINGPDI